MESVLTSKNNYKMVFIKSIAACTLMLSNLYGVECPKYEDMIIIQKTKQSKVKILFFNYVLKEGKQKIIKITKKANPYFEQINSIINKAKNPHILKLMQIKDWKERDGITFCFANHPEKTIKIQHIEKPLSGSIIVFKNDGYTYALYMKKKNIDKLYDLIDIILDKKSQVQQETKVK